MQLERFAVAIPVNASGVGTGFTLTPVTGHVLAVRYVPDGTTPYATGTVVTITAEVSGQPILTVTGLGTVATQFYPRVAVVSPANAADLFAAGGTAVVDRIPVAAERIQIALTGAGVSTTGTFHVYVG
jgi:hypothetical protein